MENVDAKVTALKAVLESKEWKDMYDMRFRDGLRFAIVVMTGETMKQGTDDI